MLTQMRALCKATGAVWSACLMSAHGTKLTIDFGQSMSALPGISDIDLLGYGKCIINFDAEVAHCAFNFGMAQEQLDGSEITCPAIYQRRLGSA